MNECNGSVVSVVLSLRVTTKPNTLLVSLLRAVRARADVVWCRSRAPPCAGTRIARPHRAHLWSRELSYYMDSDSTFHPASQLNLAFASPMTPMCVKTRRAASRQGAEPQTVTATQTPDKRQTRKTHRCRYREIERNAQP